eukprot:TRINITY_DN39325_c0_g1_i2.p1 TRINITY_DN39325_c0_g1~~TRINITY_DN39325_c0_g1_i2.p1  ORF type:complete len:94 (-),score=14.68 TRINITY_DN39325_c0_g1_i2:71-352(-)
MLSLEKQIDKQKQKVEVEKNKEQQENRTVEQTTNNKDKKDDIQEEDNSNSDNFYCDVCEKSFHTEGQWKQHEQSKKHVQATRQLNAILRKTNR